MSKPYIRRRGNLMKGEIDSFECKKCSKCFDRKDRFKEHCREQHD